MALSKKTSKIWLAKKYNLNKIVKEDIYNEYYIYTVGSFSTYEDAKEYSNELRIANNIYDAFVVKFKNGKRQ